MADVTQKIDKVKRAEKVEDSTRPNYDIWSEEYWPIKKETKSKSNFIKYMIVFLIIVLIIGALVIAGRLTVIKIDDTQSTINSNFARYGYRIFESDAERNMARIAVLPFLNSDNNDICHYFNSSYSHSCRYVVDKENKTVSLCDIDSFGMSNTVCTVSYERK